MNNGNRDPKEATPQPTNPNRTDRTAPPVDLQIIGGGLAGLVAANQAVDAGLTVRLIEKQRTPGGRAASAEHEGFTCNEGPHALYLNGELQSALTGLGITVPGSPPRLAGAIASIGADVGLLPQGPGSLLRTSLLSVSAKAKVAAIFAKLPRMKPELLADVTVDRWLHTLTDDPRVRTVLSGLVNLATYNSASDRASADVALLQLQRGLDDGVIYVDGGWSTIVSALDERLNAAEAAGTLERVTAAVTLVESGGGRVDHHAAHAEDAIYPAANILLAPGSPAVVDRLLGSGTELADAAGPPVWAAALDLGLRGEPSIGTHLGLDTRLYYAWHSVADGLAPQGCSLVSVARYVRPDDELPAAETKAILMAHAEAAAVTADNIVMTRYLRRLTVAWGMPLAARSGLNGRPGPVLADRPGIYIAGDWVGPRGLLADASGASATDAVSAVVADRSRRASSPVAVG